MNDLFFINNLRRIPDFPKAGINFRDETTLSLLSLYKNGECVQMMLDELESIFKFIFFRNNVLWK